MTICNHNTQFNNRLKGLWRYSKCPKRNWVSADKDETLLKRLWGILEEKKKAFPILVAFTIMNIPGVGIYCTFPVQENKRF